MLAATRAGLEPPSPAPATAPPGSFSADRALPRLRRILDAAGPGVPHPAGSAAGDRVRDAVVAELRALGVEPRVERSTTCNRYLACTPVANVVARIPGRGSGPAVLVATHHDSVPAGPGAADDGAGVAVALELARALLADPAAADVILLVGDAEESGLGGATAFLGSAHAAAVGAVVNLEARGTGGPCLLFETSGSSTRVARAFAGAPRPVGSSLLAAVYALLPNDTDLTVLRRLPVPEANLAFVHGAVRYHTPRDDLEHLDPGTVQQQGDGALALVRGLAVPAGDEGQSTWFDLLGRRVARYPLAWNVPLAALALLLALAAAARDVRRRSTTAARVAVGALALPIALLLSFAGGLAAGRTLDLDPVFRPWVASPGPLVAAFFLAGAGGAAAAGLLLASRAGPAGIRAGARLALALVALPLALRLPGAAYLALAPSVAWGLSGLAAGRDRAAAGDALAVLAGSLVLLPPAWLLYPGLGHAAGPVAAATVALAALPLVPLAAALTRRQRVAAVAVPALAAYAAALLAMLQPPADLDSPERVVVYVHQDEDAGRTWVLAHADVGRLPPEVRAAAPFSADARPRLGWGRLRPSFAAPATPLPVPGPEVEVLAASRDGDRLRWRARIRSPRGAPQLQLAIPPEVDVASLAVDGIPVPRPAPKLARWYGGWSVLTVLAPPGGAEVELAATARAPAEVVVADRSPDLPPEAARVAAARPAWVVTQQEGDGTLVTRTVRIEPGPPPVR